MIQISNETQLKEALNNDGAVFVLKHSTTCPISQAAFEEYEKFSNENPNLNCYFLTVQDAILLLKSIMLNMNLLKHFFSRMLMSIGMHLIGKLQVRL